MRALRNIAASATVLAVASLVVPGAAQAATFSVFEAGTATLLGTFDAPAGGGAVTAGSFGIDGGVFDVPTGLADFPAYDPVDNVIRGIAAAFGRFSNSVAYNTFDIASNPVVCGIGQCILSFTDSADPGNVPAEWYLDYIPGNPADAAALDFGYYQIAPVPLPAGAVLLLSALGLGYAGLRRRA